MNYCPPCDWIVSFLLYLGLAALVVWVDYLVCKRSKDGGSGGRV